MSIILAHLEELKQLGVLTRAVSVIMNQGRFWDVKDDLPHGVRRGREKYCYKNAALLAMDEENYTYVEGYAVISKELPVPLEHAWVVDNNGLVVEVTWEKPGSEYFGIPFNSCYLVEQLFKNRVYGLLNYANSLKLSGPFGGDSPDVYLEKRHGSKK